MKRVEIRRPDATLVCVAEVADGPLTRMRGLLGRHALPAEAGLLIKPCSSVHCHFMQFTIDVVYLDREARVVKVTTVPPWRMSAGGRGAHDVIELAAGRAAEVGLQLGETLQITLIQG